MSCIFQLLKTWSLPSINIIFLLGLISACYSPSISIIPISSSVIFIKPLPEINSTETPNTEIISEAEGIYRSDRFGFEFNYSPDEVVIEETNQFNNKLLQSIRIKPIAENPKNSKEDSDKNLKYSFNICINVYNNFKIYPSMIGLFLTNNLSNLIILNF